MMARLGGISGAGEKQPVWQQKGKVELGGYADVGSEMREREMLWKASGWAVAMTILVLLIMLKLMQMAVLSSSECCVCVCVCLQAFTLECHFYPWVPNLNHTRLERCSVKCRMFDNIPGLYTLNARRQYVHGVPSFQLDNQKCLQTLWNFS